MNLAFATTQRVSRKNKGNHERQSKGKKMIIGVISTDEASGGIKYYIPWVCIDTWEKPPNCDNNMDMFSNDSDDDYGDGNGTQKDWSPQRYDASMECPLQKHQGKPLFYFLSPLNLFYKWSNLKESTQTCFWIYSPDRDRRMLFCITTKCYYLKFETKI